MTGSNLSNVMRRVAPTALIGGALSAIAEMMSAGKNLTQQLSIVGVTSFIGAAGGVAVADYGEGFSPSPNAYQIIMVSTLTAIAAAAASSALRASQASRDVRIAGVGAVAAVVGAVAAYYVPYTALSLSCKAPCKVVKVSGGNRECLCPPPHNGGSNGDSNGGSSSIPLLQVPCGVQRRLAY